MAGWTRRRAIGAVTASTVLAGVPGHSRSPGTRATLFRDVTLVDGTGAAPRPADLLVQGDRVLRFAPAKSIKPGNAKVIAGDGRMLAPGFIDLHSHGDPLESGYDSFLAMGVTTIVLGQDGGGPRVGKSLDLRPWLQAVEAAPNDVNVVALSSHGTLRRAVGISDAVRRPDEAALARMAAQLEAELRAGAFGLSYGLEYVPGIYAERAELSDLGSVVSRFDGVVMSHMRSEDDDQIASAIDELIASSLPARPHISHLKVVYGKSAARADALLTMIAAKRRQGIELSADAYPYTASYTGVSLLFPEWALPPTDYAAIVATRGPELRAYLEKRMARRGGPEKLLIGTTPYAGKTVAQAAQEAGLPFPELLLKLGPTGASGAHFVMDEAVQDRLFADPTIAVSTDGGPGMRHPRATGTFARLIEDCVIRTRSLSIEQAVHKGTGLAARILRLPDRGIIRPGAMADLILFDPARIKARSTYLDPFAKAEGFDLAMVNGRVAYEGGERRERSGRLLRSRHRVG